jgi:transcriptional regulator with XRE-family HTH domain
MEKSGYLQPNGPEIARLRAERNLSTRQQLAKKVGCHVRTIDNLENGKRVRARTMWDVAQALNCRLEDIVVHATGVDMSVRAAVAKDSGSQFVGRNSELEVLKRMWNAASAGQGSTVLVTGERGVGKTWLIREFMQSVQRSLTFASWVSCPEVGGEFFPFRQMLTHLTSQAPNLIRSIDAPFWKNPDPVSLGLVRGANSSIDIDLQMLKILSAYAEIHPMVLVFEDVHRASRQSIDLIELITKHNPGALLMICEFRPLEAASDLKRIIENLATANAKTLALEPFNKQETRLLLHEKWGRSFQAAHWFIDDLLAWSGGTPFNIQLRLDGLMRAGATRQTSNDVELLWSREQILRFTPEDKEKEVDEFLLGLRPLWRDILKAASIEGKQFHPIIIAKVLQLTPDEVEEALRSLRTKHGIVRRLELLPPPSENVVQQWEFSHGIFRDAVRAQVPSEKRSNLSRAVAHALVELLGGENEGLSARLAELFEAGEEWELAAHYRQIAAQNASRCFDDYAGIDHANHGLVAVARIPPSVARDRMELRFNMTRGILESATRGFSSEEVERSYSRAEELSRRLNDEEYHFASIWGLWVYRLVRAEMGIAVEQAESMVKIADAAQSAEQLAEANCSLGLTKLFQGNIVDSVVALEKGLAAYELITKDTQNLLLRLDPKVNCLSMLARAFHQKGMSGTAVDFGEQALAHAKYLQQPYSIAFATMFLSYLHYFDGEMTLAADFGKRSAEIAEEQGLHQVRAWALLSYFRALGEAQEHRKESISLIRGVLLQLENAYAKICYPQFVSMLAEIMVLDGEFEQALQEVEVALQMSVTTGNRDYEPELLRLKGHVISLGPLQDRQGGLRFLDAAAQMSKERGATTQHIRALVSSLALRLGTRQEHGCRMSLREVLSTLSLTEIGSEALLAKKMLADRAIKPNSEDLLEYWQKLLSHSRPDKGAHVAR